MVRATPLQVDSITFSVEMIGICGGRKEWSSDVFYQARKLDGLIMLSQEFLIGVAMIGMGSAALYVQQFEWYRKMFFTGYWKLYDTPSGRFCANIQCGAIILVGIAMCLGMIQFDS